MAYDKMPQDLIQVSTYLGMLSDKRLKEEGVKRIWELTKDFKDLNPDEITRALANLNLKQKLEIHLESYDTNVLQKMSQRPTAIMARSNRGEVDGEQEDESGMVAENPKSYGGKRGKSNSTGATAGTQSAGGSSSGTGKPAVHNPPISVWHLVRDKLFSSKTGYPFGTTEILSKENIWTTISEDPKQQKRYTASAGKCPMCYPVPPTTGATSSGQKWHPPKVHNPLCFDGQCKTCGLWGHAASRCLNK
jgi:hypothetical protein